MLLLFIIYILMELNLCRIQFPRKKSTLTVKKRKGGIWKRCTGRVGTSWSYIDFPHQKHTQLASSLSLSLFSVLMLAFMLTTQCGFPVPHLYPSIPYIFFILFMQYLIEVYHFLDIFKVGIHRYSNIHNYL